MRVLVVDDEPAVRSSLERALRSAGYEVGTAADGNECLASVESFRPDAVILDVLMPERDGLDTCRVLRRDGNRIPVLMLTARDAVADRVDGLDAGADDYLVKPFALAELLARVRALLRRHEPRPAGPIAFADLVLDTGLREASRGERAIELTKTEYELLEMLMRHPRQVLTRSQIFEEVWDYDFGPSSNTLEVYIGYLRRKTEAGGEPRLIQTVRGVGYTLRAP